MNPRSALVAAALLMAFATGGVALGGYAIGDFHFGAPLQIDDDGDHPLAAADQVDGDALPPPTGPATDYHVCTGCDSRVAHVREWVPSPDGSGREGGWRAKTAGEEDGWVEDEYASARKALQGIGTSADDSDDDEDAAPVTAAPSVALGDTAIKRLVPLDTTGI